MTVMQPNGLPVAICLAIALSCGTGSSLAADKPFAHPGILHSRTELDFVKSKVAAGRPPGNRPGRDSAVTPSPSWTGSPSRPRMSSGALQQPRHRRHGPDAGCCRGLLSRDPVVHHRRETPCGQGHRHPERLRDHAQVGRRPRRQAVGRHGRNQLRQRRRDHPAHPSGLERQRPESSSSTCCGTCSTRSSRTSTPRPTATGTPP